MNVSIEIVENGSDASVAAVRQLWTEYWNTFDLPLDFQNFATEVGTLPGEYVPPGGRLLLARIDDEVAGTAALRPLGGNACEAKRLYIKPAYRGRGLARVLLEKIVEEARQCGYVELFGDTLPAMAAAMELYRKMGFVEVAPYSESPTPGAIYLRLSL